MPIAAVPNYLPQADLTQASPGLRFGMYLRLWGDIDLRIDVPSKRAAWNHACGLSESDKKAMQALAGRQRALAEPMIDACTMLWLEAQCTAPFTTGLGNAHPLENGFAFLNPYGLPYLPGSGVKGVLRQAARELALGLAEDASGWTDTPAYRIEIDGKPEQLTQADVLFGRDPPSGDSALLRGALSVWDVLPQLKGNRLQVDVMTPHQSRYLQGLESPHESGQPNPINFLTVPPGSTFAFHVGCNLPRLRRLAPDLAEADRWQALLRAAFEHAFAWLGFGAKTAVGYGAMQRDKAAEAAKQQRSQDDLQILQARRLAAAQRAAQERQARARQKALDAMRPGQRAVVGFIEDMQQRHEQLRGSKGNAGSDDYRRGKDLAARASQAADWTRDDKRAAADAIELWLPRLVNIDAKDLRKKLGLAALRA